MWMSVKAIRTFIFAMAVFLLGTAAFAQELKLSDLTEEALNNNPEIKASLSKIEAARYRVPQATSLPDPTLTFGYQNEGFDRYSYGEEQGSQWMFSASQQFLFPGKRSLKGEMVQRDVESMEAMHELLKLKTWQESRNFISICSWLTKISICSRTNGISSLRIEDDTRPICGRSCHTAGSPHGANGKIYASGKRRDVQTEIQSLEAMLQAG